MCCCNRSGWWGLPGPTRSMCRRRCAGWGSRRGDRAAVPPPRCQQRTGICAADVRCRRCTRARTGSARGAERHGATGRKKRRTASVAVAVAAATSWSGALRAKRSGTRRRWRAVEGDMKTSAAAGGSAPSMGPGMPRCAGTGGKPEQQKPREDWEQNCEAEGRVPGQCRTRGRGRRHGRARKSFRQLMSILERSRWAGCGTGSSGAGFERCLAQRRAALPRERRRHRGQLPRRGGRTVALRTAHPPGPSRRGCPECRRGSGEKGFPRALQRRRQQPAARRTTDA